MQWGLKVQPQMGQSHGGGSCQSLLLLSGPGGALQLNKQSGGNDGAYLK